MFEDTIERTWRHRLFGVPRSVEEAIALCKDVGIALVFITAIGSVILLGLVPVVSRLAPLTPLRARFGPFLVPMILAGAGINVLLGTLIWKARSRAAAVITLLFFSVDMVIRVVRFASIGPRAAIGLFVGVVMLWVGIRAVQGTFAAHTLAAAARTAIPGVDAASA